jgi:hypothetical protein
MKGFRMKYLPHKLFWLVALFIIGSSSNAHPDDKIIQLALFNPVQIFHEDYSIKGLRLNLIYGNNASVTGLDIGLVNRTSGKQSVGVQWGIVGLADRGFLGIQSNGVNISEREFRGVQFGLVNMAEDANGLMLGILNYARRMNGIQIGIINLIGVDGAAPILPIVNWSF